MWSSWEEPAHLWPTLSALLEKTWEQELEESNHEGMKELVRIDINTFDELN